VTKTVAKISPQKQLGIFLDRYEPAIAALGRAALAKMSERLPGAVQLVYDNYNALVIGFGPNERASDALFSIALYPRWVNLFFLYGAFLPDPDKLLEGSGKQVRSIRLKDTATLNEAPVQALIATALRQSDVPFDTAVPTRIVIKSISDKQRPRRPR
jgi:hypothetical protein